MMSPAQTQYQEQLQRKHEELQQMILQQQQELRLVSDQLLMARYGILPASLLNVCTLVFFLLENYVKMMIECSFSPYYVYFFIYLRCHFHTQWQAMLWAQL